MYLVHVVPIARGIGRDTLSYFSIAKPQNGALVSVPLRTRNVPAVVVGSEEASSQKSALRSSSFSIKKLSAKTTDPFFLPAFVDAVRDTAMYTAANVGAVFYAATPSSIVEKTKGIQMPLIRKLPKENKKGGAVIEKLVFQAERDERFDRYRSFIREEFARGSSVFLCVPTIEDGAYAYETLQKGIDRYIEYLHSSLPAKELRARWNRAVSSAHPVCIVATGSFLSLPRPDLGTIIVEREYSRAYKGQMRPYLDMRMLAEKLAERLQARLVLAGLPLRTETIFRYQNGDLDELARLKTRFAGTQTSIIDMRAERGIRGEFIVVGDTLKKAITEAGCRGEHTFVFAARRGLAPTVVCGDCGETTLCHACGAGVVLHKSAGHNVFLCHACGASRSAHETCAACKSWKLVPLGVGTERVADAISQTFSDAPVMVLDQDRAKGHAQATKIRDAFLATKSAILVGTEMALSYLHQPIPLIAVASADALLSLPEWRTRERIFSTLVQLRELASERFLIQTRKPAESLFAQVQNGLVAEFYREEIGARKQYGYPPFSVLIKFSVSGSRTAVEAEIERLSSHFESDGFISYAPSLHLAKGRYVMHGLIRKPKESWPDDDLLAKIRALPPSIAVDVEPERLM